MGDIKSVHYDAFISYKHSELDGFVAEQLHRKLESFRLPKSVRSKVPDGRFKLERVFRDVDELGLTEELSEPINAALANSDYLITICTPRYIESVWCMKEIETFLKTHGRDKILVVLAEGEPSESFPEILTYEDIVATDENGNEITVHHTIEPLAADTRGADKKEIRKAIDVAVMKLCATIFGLNYDDLKQRHKEQKVRRMTIISGSIGIALLLIAFFATIALIQIGKQNRLISEQYDELQEKYSGSMAAVSNELFKMGRKKDAVYAARNVLPDDGEGSVNAAALQALYREMGVFTLEELYVPTEIFENNKGVEDSVVSPDGEYVMLVGTTCFSVYDSESGELIKAIDAKKDLGIDEEYISAYFYCNEGVVFTDENNAYYCPINEDGIEVMEDFKPYADFVSLNDGRTEVVFCDGKIKAYDSSCSFLYEIILDDVFPGKDLSLYDCYSDDDIFACSLYDSDNYYIIVVDKNDGHVIADYTGKGYPWGMDLCGTVVYVSGVDINRDDFRVNTVILAWDYASGETLWNTQIAGCSTNSVTVVSDAVFVDCIYMLTVLDRNDGSTIEVVAGGGRITCTWVEDGIYYYMLDDGKVYSGDGEYNGYEVTDYVFVEPPSSEYGFAKVVDGDIFFRDYTKNYTVRYSREKNNNVQFLRNTSDSNGNEMEYGAAESAFDVILSTFGDEKSSARSAQFSDDGKLIFVLNYDYTIEIYDAETLELLSIFEGRDDDFYFDCFCYCETAGGYALCGSTRTYLIDEDYEIFCVLDGKLCGDDGTNLKLLKDGYLLYSVPWVGYDELLKMTDDYLGDYVPSDMIRIKYNIVG
ncbi:MAG: TIR domain-containing protein [Lachnospiraceae bacterium]|nr:TIR domain-containing protein [Lachnospiraceae bacterium]